MSPAVFTFWALLALWAVRDGRLARLLDVVTS